MIIVEGNYGKNLSRALAKLHKARLVEVDTKKYANRDSRVIIQEDVKGEECVVVQSMATRTNHALVELLLIADALIENGAKSVKAVVPFLGYSYQNRHFDNEPVSCRVVARMISSSVIDEITVVDLHALNCLEYFEIPVTNITTDSLFSDFAQHNNMSGYTVVAPDKGSHERAIRFAGSMGWDYALMNKRRDVSSLRVVDNELTQGSIGRKCVIIDDSINSGGTVVTVTDTLRQMGAEEVVWMVTHYLGVIGSEEKVMGAIDMLVTTNTVDHGLSENEKIRIIDASRIIGI